MKQLTTKRLLAGILVACVCSAAAAADKAPSLADVLKTSGVDVTGYIDASYQNKSTDPGTNTFHNYDTEQRSFELHALDTTISALPVNGFGGLLELTLGKDASVNAPVGQTAGTNVDALQIFTQYSSGPFSVMAGKFTTIAGAEVAQAVSNTNFSRSFLFTFAEPLTHTGVRANYAASNNLKFTLGINNGWNILNENAGGNCVGSSCATGKTLELGISGTPAKVLSLAGAFYSGDEVGATQIGTRTLVDVVATVTLSDALNLVFNYDDGQQDNAVAAGTAKWQGLASYLNYQINGAWRLSARLESFDDKQGFRTGTAQKLKEVTLTAGYAPAKNTELRFEVRSDKSDQSVFVDGGTNKKSQDSIGIEAVYKF
jgi:Putative beta-barrel porin-2, OmpL-like. bbp2